MKQMYRFGPAPAPVRPLRARILRGILVAALVLVGLSWAILASASPIRLQEWRNSACPAPQSCNNDTVGAFDFHDVVVQTHHAIDDGAIGGEALGDARGIFPNPRHLWTPLVTYVVWRVYPFASVAMPDPAPLTSSPSLLLDPVDSSVPEPATLVLLGLGLLWWVSRQPKRLRTY